MTEVRAEQIIVTGSMQQPPSPLYLHKFQIINGLPICIYRVVYTYCLYFSIYPPWVAAGSRSGPGGLGTRRWAQFWPFFNYMQGVKDFGGKQGGWMACESPLMTIEPS
jgi:hypothetical protein